MNIDIPDREESLELIIGELNWKQIKKFITSITNLKKIYEKGGFRIDSGNKKHAVQVIYREITSHNIENIFPLFIDWCSQKNYNKLLNSYFESENYLNFIKNKTLNKNEYLLEDVIFDQLCEKLNRKEGLVFIHFSPVKFSDEQIKKILNLKDIDITKQESIKIEIPSDYKELKQKIKYLERQTKELGKNNDELSNKNAELIKKIKDNKDESSIDIQHIRNEIEIEIKNALEEKNKEVEKIVIDLEKKYEEELRKNKEFEQKITKLKSKINRPIVFLEILKYIDYDKIIGYINSPDGVNDKIKEIAMSRDENIDPIEENYFKKVWFELIEREKNIFNKLYNIKPETVFYKNYTLDWWGEKIDQINCLITSLNTRLVLIQVLHEALRQYHDKNR